MRRRPAITLAAVVLAAAAATFVLVLHGRGGSGIGPAAVGSAAPWRGRMPFAVGDSAGNIPLDDAQKRVLVRWVARRTGTLKTLYLHVKVEGSSGCPYGRRPGYAKGTSGLLAATTYRVSADGRPDQRQALASVRFVPCARQDGESVDLPLGFAVRAGEEFATVVRNVDAAPEANWFSMNFLYIESGLVGATARNERSAAAGGADYGLDPRELVGYSTNGGATWSLPGGPYGRDGGKVFVPTFLERYADGVVQGQPFYYSSAADGTTATVEFPAHAAWTIRAVGAFSATAGTAPVRVLVDGRERARAVLRALRPGLAEVAIAAVPVARGQIVRVEARLEAGGLSPRRLAADAVWTALAGLGAKDPWYRGVDDRPQNPYTIYPLPMYTAG